MEKFIKIDWQKLSLQGEVDMLLYILLYCLPLFLLTRMETEHTRSGEEKYRLDFLNGLGRSAAAGTAGQGIEEE